MRRKYTHTCRNFVDENEPPDQIDAPDSDSDDEDDEDEEAKETNQGIASRTRRQTGTVVNPPERYTLASVKVKKIEKVIKKKLSYYLWICRDYAPYMNRRTPTNATCFQ